MSASPTIGPGKVVTFFYAVRDDAGRLLDGTRYQEPLRYLHGAGSLLPALERALAGKGPGERVHLVLSPDEAYGPRDDARLRRVPLAALPPDVEPVPGGYYAVQGTDGAVKHVRIVAVEGEEVVLDLNHPFAGLTLHFDVTVAAVAGGGSGEPSPEEGSPSR